MSTGGGGGGGVANVSITGLIDYQMLDIPAVGRRRYYNIHYCIVL